MLKADVIGDVPNHLSLLMKLGNKFVPFPDPRHFLSNMSRKLTHEFLELRRVLVWHVYHQKHPSSKQSHYPPFESFPYKRMYVRKGTSPPPVVEQAIPHEVRRIDSAFGTVANQLRLYLEHLVNGDNPKRGVSLCKDKMNDFLSSHIVVPTDKDGGSIIVSKGAYLHEASCHMSSTLNDKPVYRMLGDTSTVTEWEEKAKLWQHRLAMIAIPCLPESLTEFLQQFFDNQPPPKLPVFYLLAKTHKQGFGLSSIGRFPSRPVVGMHRWATTPCSIFLATCGTILLKADRALHPLSAPLLDTIDLLGRLRHLSQDQQGFADGREWVASSYDFDALYTHFKWSDIAKACDWWRRFVIQHLDDMSSALSSQELSMISCFFGDLDQDFVSSQLEYFPYMNNEPDDSMFLGKFLMNVVFHHCIFLNEGIGVFLQLVGFAMGTNCAPAWAQLVLRMYELQNPLPPHLHLFRYIDDGLLLHPISVSVANIQDKLKQVYPPHSPSSFCVNAAHGNVPFLDVLVVSVTPLRTSVYWKASHSCAYLPWRSNLPRHIKCTWIRGGCIRYLRICSEQSFFRVCRLRLVTALSFLDYPEAVIRSNLLPWEDRDRVLIPRRQRVTNQILPGSSPSLSQCEQSVDGVEHGGGGWVGIPCVHVLRAWHHSAVPVSWPRVVHCLSRRLPFLKHSAKLYAILRPLTSVKRFFRTAARAALQGR